MWWYWAVAGPAITLALLSLRGGRARAQYIRNRLTAPEGLLPPATVIVPVKGDDEGLRDNLLALASQAYPDYELIVCAHSADDVPRGVLPPYAKVVLAYGDAPNTAEKIQNLMAAVHAARKHSEVYAFADSDGRPTARWLRSLVAPLAEKGVGASTGYRWFMPDPADFWSMLRAAWDAVAAGVLGPGDNRFAWGGAMAIRKDVFYDAGVPEAWKGRISDDYALSAAVRAKGLKIVYAPGALTPSREHIEATRFFGWIRRQMSITRAYAPALWWPGLIAHVFYCSAMVMSVLIAVRGYRLAWIALALQLLPGMWKARQRVRLAGLSLPEHDRWFERCTWAHVILSPVATWAWLFALGSSGFVRTIEWRGRRYRL